MYTLCSHGNFYLFIIYFNFIFPFIIIILFFEIFLFLNADDNSNIDTGESEIVFSRYDESASKQASNAWPRGVEVRNEKFWAYIACEQALHGERSDGTRKGACLPLSRLFSRTAHSWLATPPNEALVRRLYSKRTLK